MICLTALKLCKIILEDIVYKQNLPLSVHCHSVKQCATTGKPHKKVDGTEFWCLDTRTPIYLIAFVSTFISDGLSGCCSLHLIEAIHSQTTFSSYDTNAQEWESRILALRINSNTATRCRARRYAQLFHSIMFSFNFHIFLSVRGTPPSLGGEGRRKAWCIFLLTVFLRWSLASLIEINCIHETRK